MTTLILDPISNEALKYGTKKLDIIPWDNPDIEKYFDKAEAVIVRTYKISKDIIDCMPNLRIIAKHGVGVDNIDLEYAKSKNIIVTNTPLANMNSVAELVLAMTLACARKVSMAHNQIIEGITQNSPFDLMGMELENKTVGLIGSGKIGSLVGKKFKLAFNMKVIVYDEFISDEKCKNLGFEKYQNLDDLLSESDVINISVPLTNETENMITARELSLMKQDAILINTARGKIINESDLFDALKNKKIFGAGIDAFAEEPVSKHNKLLDCVNFIGSPHNGANTKEALIRMGTQSIDEITRLANGEKNIHIVN